MTSEFAVAVHSVVYLNQRQITTSSEELATNVCTNPARIRKVMSKLKKAGIIETKEGLEGGYHLIQEPSSINLKQICDALEVSFVSSSWKSGDENLPCMVASGMSAVMDEVYGELNELCRNKMEQITIKDVQGKLISNRLNLETMAGDDK
ncbi:RrF2 family transcriptional regulator [Lacrimispora algidixylanolytica]|jgi:Rrf2 family protein|uniref:Rrf2 family transcriptional regulator n=1 Tax=Lacrimispora algidixylanolytica TaxID=94868 RepID=A0A419TD00_9FIRM|nr:Rrf2 family transcriptional regulator [Lacrimispora algidixylanolytica]RKD35361.1 Rrf2 family transcriptional regulator [Lacrimispora algidixylanolytica]